MTTADPLDVPERHRTPLPGWFAAARHALDRPLTAYYLLLGASALLLTIGLIMVLSSSSVYSYEQNGGDSYAVVKRQLLWMVVGVPCAWIASRMSHRVLRRFAWLGLIVSIVLLALTQTGLGVEVNGNTNWLGVGPFVIQPAEMMWTPVAAMAFAFAAVMRPDASATARPPIIVMARRRVSGSMLSSRIASAPAASAASSCSRSSTSISMRTMWPATALARSIADRMPPAITTWLSLIRMPSSSP